MNKAFAGLFIAILFLSCGSNDDSLYPLDYLIAQRSFPHGLPSKDVYREALAWRHDQLSTNYKSKVDSWESLGPNNMDGRITDIEFDPDDDQVIYAASASGGVFRSADRGMNWEPLFDKQECLAIGDLAISLNNSELIYAGTGESNAGGGSIAYDGHGVYRSDDAGDNWRHLGLDNAGSIGRIAIDPNDDNRLFVACMGHLFENNPDRGIYRSVNGGLSWEQVLFLSDSTGGIDLAIHPDDGNIVYAAMWERIRRPHNRQYGGASSGIYKSLDGGDNWVELTNGLPFLPSQKGRIGIAISESHPDILYAWYADQRGFIQGLYRSDNGGESWIEKSTDGIDNVSFMWWFGRIYVDPFNPDKVYVTSLHMFASDDGADSWYNIFPSAHVDHHALAISRQTEGLIFNGNDGGVDMMIEEIPGADAYFYRPGMANFQFYTCAIDPVEPDNIYGGAQDNGIVVSKNSSLNWDKLFGGDGFRIIIDPEDNSLMYFETQNGNMFRADTAVTDIQYLPVGISGVFNWNTPIEMDPNDSRVIYTGTQRLYRSENRGDSWEELTEELVSEDRPQGNIQFGTLTAIEVSPLNSDIIYVGTDDGNVWISRDYGSSFDNISLGIPKRWITSIHADPFFESGVYLTVSGFRFGESNSHVYYSSDYGFSWTSIGQELPDVPVNEIIADPTAEGFLYLATDMGVFFSPDYGDTWHILGLGMPNVPVLDIDYSEKQRFLVAASYGRGMYKYDLDALSHSQGLISENLNIFPNPGNGLFHLEGWELVSSIIVVDPSGREIYNVEATGNLDLGALEDGLYYLWFVSPEGSTVQKIIIQN